ncbi:MAG TPA: hypothetical protein VJQ84_01210 [Solirubrobacterales bacterium]|nr:hypothetical protein [Solirubrobacterales bacterium]
MNLIGIKSTEGCAPEIVDRWGYRYLDALCAYSRRWETIRFGDGCASLDKPGFISFRDADGNTGALVNLDASLDPAALARSLAGPVGEPDSRQLAALLADATAHEIDRAARPVFYLVESFDCANPRASLTYPDAEAAVSTEARRWNERSKEETLIGQLRDGTGIISLGPLRAWRAVLLNPERDRPEGTFALAARHLFGTYSPTDEQVEQLRQRVAAVRIYPQEPELVMAASVEAGDVIDLEGDGGRRGEPRTVSEVREIDSGNGFYVGFDNYEPGVSLKLDERVWLMHRPDEWDPADSIGERAQGLAEQAADQVRGDLDGVMYRAVVGAIEHGNFAGDVDPLLVVAFESHFVRVLRQLIENGLREGPGDKGSPPANPTTYVVHKSSGTTYALDGGDLIWCPTSASGVPLWGEGGLLEHTDPEHVRATDVIHRALEKLAEDDGEPDPEFNLSVRLVNAAMNKPGDVAEALRKAADQIARGTQWSEGESVLDSKGQVVGFWTVTLPDPQEGEGE